MTGKKLLHIQIIVSLLCVLLVTISTSLCYHGGILSRLDNFLFDLNIKWRGPMPTSGYQTIMHSTIRMMLRNVLKMRTLKASHWVK